MADLPASRVVQHKLLGLHQTRYGVGLLAAAGAVSRFDDGGHYPAHQVPDLLVGDLRQFFTGLRG